MGEPEDIAERVVERPREVAGRRVWIALAAIILLGLALRVSGLAWSLPDQRHPISTYHPDELVNLGAAQAADIAHGKFDIGFYNYGTFYFYLVSLADTIGHGYHWIPSTSAAEARNRTEIDALRLQARERAGEFLAGRLVAALMGTGTIPVIFLLGRRMYNRRTGLLAALFYAVAPLAALHAHFLAVDVPATLFVSLALLYAARLRDTAAWRDVGRAALWCGLAAATKYSAVLCILAPAVALLVPLLHATRADRSDLTRQSVPKVSGLLCFTALVFLIACPGPWLNWHAFWAGTYPGSGVRYELLEHARTGHGYVFVDTGPGWWYHLTVSLRYGLGLPLLMLCVAGGAYAVYRREPSDVILLVFVAIAYLTTSMSAVRFARYLLPLYPALFVLAARVAVLPDAGTALRRAGLAAAALVAMTCTGTSAGLVRAMQLTDPRDRAADYLTTHALSRPSIAFAHIPWYYSPPLSPLWGALRSDVRAHAPPAQSGLEFRMPNGDWDPAVLTPTPDYVVLSNIELAVEYRRLRLAPAVAWMEALPADATQLTFSPGGVPGLSPNAPNAPQDMLYALPEITIYALHKRLTRDP